MHSLVSNVRFAFFPGNKVKIAQDQNEATVSHLQKVECLKWSPTNFFVRYFGLDCPQNNTIGKGPIN